MLTFEDKIIKGAYDTIKLKKSRDKFISRIEEKLEKNIPLRPYEERTFKRYKYFESLNWYYIRNENFSIEYQVSKLEVSNFIEEFIKLNENGNLLTIEFSSELIDIEKLHTHYININKLLRVFRGTEPESYDKPNSITLEIDKALKFELCDSDMVISKNRIIIINDLYELSIEVSSYKSLEELEKVEELKDLERLNKLKNRSVIRSKVLLETMESF